MVLRTARLLVVLLVGLAHRAEAATQGPNPTPRAAVAQPTPMPLDGTWIVLDEVMLTGSFFSGTWVWDSTEPVSFTITDLFIVSDEFEIYDNGAPVAATPDVPDWPFYGKNDPFDPPCFISDPDLALESAFFSNAKLKFGPGHHEITIRATHIPPVSPGGAPFVDGTVAFSAVVQVTPTGIPAASEWGLLVLSLLLLTGAKLYFKKGRPALRAS